MTEHPTWSDVSFTIDGVDVPMKPVSLEYEPKPETKLYGFDLWGVLPKPTKKLPSIECTVPLTCLHDFADLFRREPPGATAATLARRVRYGGRKGRRALRRLFTRALPIEFTTEHLVYAGKGVWLEDGDIRVQLRHVRFR